MPIPRVLVSIKGDGYSVYSERGDGPMTLRCGCRPGFFLCPVAVALWEEGNVRYRAYQAGLGTWEDYLQARAEYGHHYEETSDDTALPDRLP